MPPTHLFPPLASDLLLHHDAFSLHREPTAIIPMPSSRPSRHQRYHRTCLRPPPSAKSSYTQTNQQQKREREEEKWKDPFRILLSFIATAKNAIHCASLYGGGGTKLCFIMNIFLVCLRETMEISLWTGPPIRFTIPKICKPNGQWVVASSMQFSKSNECYPVY